jgi:sugar/nucleoside kinase (ribokinase family)
LRHERDQRSVTPLNTVGPVRVEFSGACMTTTGFVTVGSVCIDAFWHPSSEPVGVKLEGVYGCRLGGAAVNAGRVGVVNAVPTAIIGAQAEGGWAEVTRELARAEGLQPILIERADGLGLSVIATNGRRKEIRCQRMAPPRASELLDEWIEVIRTARVVLVGPLSPSVESFRLLDRLADLAPTAYRALIAHPRMLPCREFLGVAAKYSYVQVNGDELRMLPDAGSDLVINARKLASLLRTDVCVTNGPDVGVLVIGRQFRRVVPLPVDQVMDETGCGDVFCGAWALGKGILGLDVDRALGYALRCAASMATIRTPVAFETVVREAA